MNNTRGNWGKIIEYHFKIGDVILTYGKLLIMKVYPDGNSRQISPFDEISWCLPKVMLMSNI